MKSIMVVLNWAIGIPLASLTAMENTYFSMVEFDFVERTKSF